jgi:mannose-1-phosphate guanylyltransferase
MAGGVGSRFWPLSRTNKPKQFLDILGVGESLLQSTYKRFRKIIPPENIIVVTNEVYGDHVKEQLPEISPENILLEPSRRNTAPCIAYAAYRIHKKNPNAVMVVAPSDHLIVREGDFLHQVEEGLAFVGANDVLLTLGIKPDKPETGYGYIQINGENGVEFGKSVFKKVKTFTEKPNLELAKIFLESGDFFWNAGIFFWSVNSILTSFEKFLPDVNIAFKSGESVYETNGEKSFIEKTYSVCSSISIDYGVMEKADNAYVLPTDFGWSDLGTWGSLYDRKEKDANQNAVIGENVFAFDVKNSVISAPTNKLIVLQGLDNYIVVDSDDILLICKKDEEQRIKHFVNDVKISKGEHYG